MSKEKRREEEEAEERRSYALEKAIEHHRMQATSTPTEHLVDTARQFEEYLKGESVAPKPPLDPNKANHFFHDSEGCPYVCDSDSHNHPALPS